MTDAPTLDDFLTQGWDLLIRGVHDRHAPARHPTFATVDAQGRPQMRTVVLRAAARDAATCEVHTDTATAKVQELRTKPVAGLHVWSQRAHLQLRLTARVEIVTGDATKDRWAQVPPASRVAYGTEPAPGTPIAGALDYSKPADPARFAVLLCHLTEIEVLHLGPEHRRALFTAQDGWAGRWLSP